jgi:hypothetical protein
MAIEPTPVNHHHESDHPAVLTEDEARQGETGHNVRYVLAFGTAGVVLLFFLILSFYIAR